MKDKALGMALEFFETMKRYKRVRSNIFIRFEPTATGDYLDLREFDERAEPTITAIKQALAAPVQEPVVLGSTVEQLEDAMDLVHEFGGPLHERIKALIAKTEQKPVGRTDQQIVDQTEELAVWLLSWCFNHQPETATPMRESTHPFAERCWSAACHIQEMLTDTDPENSVAELDVDATPPEQPVPVQEPCDMGNICAGCSPRNADGSCPHEKENLACDCYVKGFNDGMKEMDERAEPTIAAIKQALAAPVQEPVAIPREWRTALRKLAFMARTSGGTVGHDSGLVAACEEAEALLSKPYTTPQPQRGWVRLTDEEIDDLAEFHGLDFMSYAPFTRAIEAKIKEKNT
jgi:hypothetical protein